MDRKQAQRVLDSLRKGIPPDGFIGHFTVGREDEIRTLGRRLGEGDSGCLLLKANYGCGKSHLLRFVRETALEHGYAVSTVTLDARSAVRFNRMDQIMGAIWRGLEIPSAPGKFGPAPFFDFLSAHLNTALARREKNPDWRRISGGYLWDNPYTLRSQAVYIALRCWVREDVRFKAQLEDWLCQPWLHNTSWLADYIRRRTPYQLRKKDIDFKELEYDESWAALQSIDTLAKVAGLKGFLILFDEFEDVFNLRHKEYEKTAFSNLFAFFKGREFGGTAYFAVTPGFVEKCKRSVLVKGCYDYDLTRFDALPTFEMSPLDVQELRKLALRIVETHAIAYTWNPSRLLKRTDLDNIVDSAARVAVQDRARHAVKSVVKMLDSVMEDEI